MTFKPTKEQIQAAKDLFKAQVEVKVIRPIIIGYETKILADNQFKHARTNENITDPKDSWLMSDADFVKYNTLCNAARKAAGLHVDNEEYCPLLVAEEKVRKAENALMDAMSPVTGILSKDVNCHLDIREKYVDLNNRFMINYV